MSVYKLPYLYCDGDACPREDSGMGVPYVIDPLPGDTAASIRADAKHQGWARRNGKDYCPLCLDALSATQSRVKS